VEESVYAMNVDYSSGNPPESIAAMGPQTTIWEL
jgi:hypothetical protein